jgi:hypothetical protein
LVDVDSILAVKPLAIGDEPAAVVDRANKVELEKMDYLEFIARTTSHIPDKGQMAAEAGGDYFL